MHLVDVLSVRTVPAAGVTLGLTRRCPLHCAHCSTRSTLDSEQAPAEMFERFVDSFGPEDRPQFLVMSGGEAMLRPDLVRTLAERARAVGTRSMALSGMFFARSRGIPPRIRSAIESLDHFSASIDAFHEREVPRANVLRVLDSLLAAGMDVSLHLVGRDAGDPYLERITAEVRRALGDRVPMFVNGLGSFGRAREWLDPAPAGARAERVEADPCGVATWPVVGFDGTVVACGNDDVIEGPTPSHLRLGHLDRDGWPEIRARSQRSSMVRALRLYGPRHLADRFRAGGLACDGYCQSCMTLPEVPGLEARVEELMARASTRVVEEEVSAMQLRAGAVSFARRHGIPRYAELVTCGARA